MAIQLVAATNNRHKLEELRRLLASGGYEVLSLGDVGITSDPPETGETFAENAVAKARMAAAASGRIAIGDDSGLCVDVLDGAPGVLSARFSGVHGDDEANNKKLLNYLNRTPYARRTARMVCALAVAAPDGSGLEVEGSCEGMIGIVASGSGGFGYDSLFYVGNESFADMPVEKKDEISHRARAFKALAEKLPDFIAQHSQDVSQ